MLKVKPATILAATALVVAVFGSTPLGHAAAGLVLAKNSVGAAQLKKSSVTSAKVKNGSLLAADFKAGQLLAGPQGVKGEIGPQGQQGDAGPQGAKGDPGAQGAPGLAFLGASLHQPIATNAGGVSAPITLTKASRLLVHGILVSSSYPCAAASPVVCKIQLVPVVDGVEQPTSLPTISIPQGQTKGLEPETQLLAVTAEVPAGQHYVGYGIATTGQFLGTVTSFGPRQVFAIG